MRVLQVGLGRFGQSHLRSWRKLAVDLRVCDRDPARLAALEEPCSADWRAFLDDAECVDVVTSATSHEEIARAALERGKHVLVEKPITPTAREGFELAALARERGCLLQVGHVFRFAPEARAVERAVRSGAIGRIRYALGHFMSFKRPRTDGGLAISDGVHLVDLVSWIFGKQPIAVTAVLRDYLGRGMDDAATLALDYGGESALVEAACFPPEPRRDLHVIGTEGAITCDFLADADRVKLYSHAHKQDVHGVWGASEGEVRVLPAAGEEPLLAEIRAFLEACKSGHPAPEAADGVAGAAAVAVIEAAERSAREGRRVEVELPS
ncbi:MAG TPA: Gfo/Idh/MocA family oxidoreductase [Myxococcota bacterium]|nr:Gfo/Idh/MocA family oxidoreductase [Myxococcota bacterium]